MPSSPATLRCMRPEDAEDVLALAARTFTDLDVRSGRTPRPYPSSGAARDAGLARNRHLATTDPDSVFVAEREGRIVGAAIAIVREGIWGLSLLIVDPPEQSTGIGGRLLAEALASAEGCRGGAILASEDSRALRAYARAGFAMHPAVDATGVPRPLEAPAWIRPGGPDDLALVAAVDREVRGAARVADLQVMLDHGARLLIAPDRGYACMLAGEVRVLAATDAEAAADLLRAGIASVPDGERAVVDWLTSAQGWAVPIVLEAGLELAMGGAVFLRGEIGPFSPYLPSGAYL